MTYDKSNIVGVEFTAPDGFTYKILTKTNKLGHFRVSGDIRGFYRTWEIHSKEICENLNNGTWIVKNSKV